MSHCYSLDIQCVYWQLLAQITVFEQDLKNQNLQRHHYTLIQMCGRISHVALKVVSFCTSLESTVNRNILIALFSWWQFCISYWEESSNSGNTEPSVFNKAFFKDWKPLLILQDLPTIQVLAGILSVFFLHLRERKGERNLHEQKY